MTAPATPNYEDETTDAWMPDPSWVIYAIFAAILLGVLGRWYFGLPQPH